MVMNPLFRMYTASVVIVTFPGFHSINQSNQNCYNVVSYKKMSANDWWNKCVFSFVAEIGLGGG